LKIRFWIFDPSHRRNHFGREVPSGSLAKETISSSEEWMAFPAKLVEFFLSLIDFPQLPQWMCPMSTAEQVRRQAVQIALSLFGVILAGG